MALLSDNNNKLIVWIIYHTQQHYWLVQMWNLQFQNKNDTRTVRMIGVHQYQRTSSPVHQCITAPVHKCTSAPLSVDSHSAPSGDSRTLRTIWWQDPNGSPLQWDTNTVSREMHIITIEWIIYGFKGISLNNCVVVCRGWYQHSRIHQWLHSSILFNFPH